MFAEFSSWSWITSAILIGIGGVMGYIVARQIKDQRTRQLEQELAASRKALSGYRQEVNSHFLKTSLLFNKLTDDYREVYEHLAKGAQDLCNDSLRTSPSQLPNKDILPGLTTDNESVTGSDHKAAADAATPGDTDNTEESDALVKAEKVSREEKSLLVNVQSPDGEDEDVALGEESAPAIDFSRDPNRSIH